jgi:flavodoxin
MERRDLLKAGAAGIGVLAMSGTARAMGTLVAASERKKWAIVYGTQCGSTKEYAEYINEGLGGVAEVIDIARGAPAVGDYEFFVIGGWNSGNTLQPTSIPAFITTNKAALQSKIKGLFAVTGNDGNINMPDTSKTNLINRLLINHTGATNAPTKILFGRSTPSCNGFNRSYDNVSKADALAFAQQIMATALSSGQPLHPQHFALGRIATAPYRPVTVVNFTLPRSTEVRLTIFTLKGSTVTTLVAGRREAGMHEVSWNTSSLAPGYYLCRLQAENFVTTQTVRVFGN